MLVLEAGWTVTEVGRQPWVVFGVLRTADAVNPAPGLVWGFLFVTAVYLILTVGTVSVLRRMTRSTPVPLAPQEADVAAYRVGVADDRSPTPPWPFCGWAGLPTSCSAGPTSAAGSGTCSPTVRAVAPVSGSWWSTRLARCGRPITFG